MALTWQLQGALGSSWILAHPVGKHSQSFRKVASGMEASKGSENLVCVGVVLRE